MTNLRSLPVLAVLLAASCGVLAAETDPDLDTRFRARLIKEKSKLNAEETSPALRPRDAGSIAPLEGECGSQNIGNVNTNGRPGTAPREVFVFAPNAINIVNQRGCGS